MKERVLVIGGSGNIGTSVVDRLLKQGYDVTVYTRGQAMVKPNPNVRQLFGDRRADRKLFVETLKREKFDCVIDMCCQHPDDAVTAYEAFQDVKQYVFISTGAAYGTRYGYAQPIREDFSSREFPWSYSQNKRTMENFLMEKYNSEGFPVTILRPIVTYGHTLSVVRQIGCDNSWFDRIRKGKPIITGNLQLFQYFIHVDDAAWGIVGSIMHPEATIGQAYHLVGMRPYDWEEYYTAAMKAIGREVEMVEVPLDTLIAQQCEQFTISDMALYSMKYNGLYDGSKIARDIPEFGARTSLVEGMKKQIAFLDEHNLIPNSDDLTWEDEVIKLQLSTRKNIFVK